MEACQVQRGEGTISHLCLGGWGVGLAGDMAAAAEGGRGRSIGVGVPCPLRECGSTLGPRPPGPLVPASSLRVRDMGVHSFCPSVTKGSEHLCLCTTAQQLTEAVKSSSAGGPVGSCPSPICCWHCWYCWYYQYCHQHLTARELCICSKS